MAAGACKVGLRSILLLFRKPGLPTECDGNFLLDFLLGAEIHLHDLGPERNLLRLDTVQDLVDVFVQREQHEGRRAYVAPVGASVAGGSMTKPLGALAYLLAFLELTDQAAARGLEFDSVVFATGSGSMQAGLLAGAKLLRPELRVIGISVLESRDRLAPVVETIARETLEALALHGPQPAVTREDVIVLDDYIGPGYGRLNQETAESLRRVAETEGILLDPVYTGRAMVGLLDLVKRGWFPKNSNVLFLHSGGLPALFPYREDLLGFLQEARP